MIRELSLHNFRNIQRARLTFSDSFNVILGPNGSGKTSIFEGIAFAGFGNSPFGSPVSDVVKNGEDNAVIHAMAKEARISIELSREGKKKISVDQKKVDRVSDILGIFPQTLIGPNEVSIVTQGPSERRKMLNLHLCQRNRAYTSALRGYDNVLQNRNRTLKNSAHFSEGIISAIDIELARHMEILVTEREEFIEEIDPLAGELYRTIAGGDLKLTYRPSFKGSGSDFIAALKERRRHELKRRTTTIGPHRDELLIEVDGRPARDFASWGQKRISSIVILIAASRALFTGDRKPSILLDDCFAELDMEKTANLLELAPQWGQIFVAAPKPIDIPEGAHSFSFSSPGNVDMAGGR